MIIGVINQKGGTGKTTTTINLGAALAARKKRVLLIDLDPQGSLSYSLGIVDFEQSLSDVFEGKTDLSSILHETERLSVAPCDIGLADTELSLADASDREYFLKNILKDLEISYDYILIDCPPSLSVLTVNALTASQLIVIPMQMEVLSLQGLDLVSDTIEKIRSSVNSDLEVAGILPVMVDRRRKLTQEVHDHIQEHFEFRVFETMIRSNVKASEAPSFGQSVVNYAPQSNSANDYKSFAKAFIKLYPTT
ncbi:MAG: ParA family protein [Cytophagales bacterium]|nr:ParA family protein [Cytophagales bacterium]